MDEQRTPHLVRYLPLVAITTVWVAGVPSVVVWELRKAGMIDSVVLSIVLAAVLALAASQVGSRIWEARSAASDLLFSDLTLWGWARCWSAERRLANAVKLLDGVAGTEELSRDQRERLLVTLAETLEMRDPHTHGHSRRVARHAAMIAKQMGLSRPEVAKVRTAAALHDVGKLETPPSILRKPERLTEFEYRVIKLHCMRGAQLVSMLGDPQLTAVVRAHHERIDGTGYPEGLAGDEIPLGARIIAVADTFDAITSTRPYRPARSHKTALEILTHESGRQLDPAAVRAFRSYYAGRRPLALWAMLTNLPEKLFLWLGSGANTVAGSVTGAIATSAVASAVAVGAIASPLVSHPHLTTAAKAGPAHGTTGPPVSLSASPRATPKPSAPPSLKPAPALMNLGSHAPASRGRRGKGSASAPGALQVAPQRPLTASQPSSTQATSQTSSGVLAATGPSPAGTSVSTTSGSPGSGAPTQGSDAGGGQGNPTHSGSSAGSRAGGQGSGNAGGQSNGHGNANGQSNGNGNANGPSSGGGSASGQGNANAGGQGNGNAGGQGNGNAGGQGNGNASGSANAGSQGNGNVAGQGNGNGQGQANGHAKSADDPATQN